MTFSQEAAHTPREMYLYTRGYMEGYDYGLNVVLEGWEEAEADSELAPHDATETLRADPAHASRAPGAPSGPPGSSAGLTSAPHSPTNGDPDSDSGVRVAGFDEKHGVLLASHEAPGPGWVSIGSIDDDAFDSLPAVDDVAGLTADNQWYLRLHTEDPAVAEVVAEDMGQSYTPVSVSSGVIANGATIEFGAPFTPRSSWGTVLYGARYEVDDEGVCTDCDADEEEAWGREVAASKAEAEELQKGKEVTADLLHTGSKAGLVLALSLANDAHSLNELVAKLEHLSVSLKSSDWLDLL